MLPYADKLAPDDRWAVVAYVRALQRAQQGTAADVTDSAAKSSLGIQ
jgi:mono/diheme cytochrome c family protein